MTKIKLPDDTKVAHAHLTVNDMEQSLNFYTNLVGFKVSNEIDNTVLLSATGDPPYHLILTEDKGAGYQSRRAAGLFHVAIRFPSRKSLARVVKRLALNEYPIQGASDHIVSEALYLADPDGNGLEFYTDRPRELWPRAGETIEMATNPLDINDLLNQDDSATIPLGEIDPGTDIGHIHLQVTSVEKAEKFYHELLGFDVMQRSYQGAIFLSAGGYHHHIGANTWNSKEGSPHQKNTVGLRATSFEVPDEKTWNELTALMSKNSTSSIRFTDYGYAIAASGEDLDSIPVELLINKSSLSNERVKFLESEEIISF